VIVHRLCRAAHRALDGEGAFRFGGRWNRPGTAAVYGSSTLSLAALEYLVHLEIPQAPTDLVSLTISLPDPSIHRLDRAELPAEWRSVPEHPWCADFGTRWLAAGTTLALQVPSALIPEETNLLINPAHPGFSGVKVLSERPFRFDPRLYRTP
jgi:RES domain-containing protein